MPSTPNLTPLELQIMQVLWTRGPSTVAEVQAALPGEPAYTTVQTILAILLRKGKARRRPQGRAFRYAAAVSRSRAQSSTLRDLVGRMFGGDPQALLLAMVDTRQITREDLARLADRLAEEPESPAKSAPRAAPGRAAPSGAARPGKVPS